MNTKRIRNKMLKYETKYSKHASYDKEAIRFEQIIDDIRPNYFRDIDRIIHSLAYTRYIDKTQVYSLKNNDHITKRIIHVNLVSKVARTIGRALSLNEDLIEAASLGHDLGHVPFGHVGEAILNRISLKHNEGYFNHNVQSVRMLMIIEKKNLTLQVLDAILCHNGEMLEKEYKPKYKTKEEFLAEIEESYKVENYCSKLRPMTLEGCVVRISDIIAYIGRDIEDAITLNLINFSDIPLEITEVLGSTNTEIINTIVNDLIENSLNKNYLHFSHKVWQAIKCLKEFNHNNIYKNANSKKDLDFYEQAFNKLFDYYLKNINKKRTSIYKDFLVNMSNDYINNTSNPRKIIDFIAGMTDKYFLNEYNKLFL